MFPPDPSDPFNVIVGHYITTYLDEYDHTFAVLAAFNDLEGSGPEPDPVPEPATILLIGSGLAGLTALRRKEKQGRRGGL